MSCRWQQLIGVVVSIVLLSAACTSEPGANSADAMREPSPTVVPTRIPTTAPVATPDPAPEPGPSQSLADAARDGVSPVVAELPFVNRVNVIDEIVIGAERWVTSRVAPNVLSSAMGRAARTFDVEPAEAELLLIRGNRIVRAIPMPSGPAQFVLEHDDSIIAGRVGDGGYPGSAVVRVPIGAGGSDALTKLLIPFAYDRSWQAAAEAGWMVVDPNGASDLNRALQLAVAPDPDPEMATTLATAMDEVTPFDWGRLPRLSLQGSNCNVAGWTNGLLYDVHTHCVFQRGDANSAEPTIQIDATSVGGTLVGLGQFDSGPLYAAVIPSAGPLSVQERPLRLVEVDDPANAIDTTIVASDEGSTIVHVDFFGAGIVVTRSVDLATSVTVYDQAGQVLDQFVSPTDAAREYPPNPDITFASLSNDGATMIWVEREWPNDGSGTPGRRTAIVSADAQSGAELGRVEFELDPADFLIAVDYDDGWAVLSFARFGDSNAPAALPFIVDTATGQVFPLGINTGPIVTIKRR